MALGGMDRINFMDTTNPLRHAMEIFHGVVGVLHGPKPVLTLIGKPLEILVEVLVVRRPMKVKDDVVGLPCPLVIIEDIGLRGNMRQRFNS
jgi:hypothetical protein